MKTKATMFNRKISRRTMLKGIGYGAGAVALAACGGAPPQQPRLPRPPMPPSPPRQPLSRSPARWWKWCIGVLAAA